MPVLGRYLTVFRGNEFFRVFDDPSVARAAPDGTALLGKDLTGLGIPDIAGRFNNRYFYRHISGALNLYTPA